MPGLLLAPTMTDKVKKVKAVAGGDDATWLAEQKKKAKKAAKKAAADDELDTIPSVNAAPSPKSEKKSKKGKKSDGVRPSPLPPPRELGAGAPVLAAGWSTGCASGALVRCIALPSHRSPRAVLGGVSERSRGPGWSKCGTHSTCMASHDTRATRQRPPQCAPGVHLCPDAPGCLASGAAIGGGGPSHSAGGGGVTVGWKVGGAAMAPVAHPSSLSPPPHAVAAGRPRSETCADAPRISGGTIRPVLGGGGRYRLRTAPHKSATSIHLRWRRKLGGALGEPPARCPATVLHS
jgi:hypothetical protein